MTNPAFKAGYYNALDETAKPYKNVTFSTATTLGDTVLSYSTSYTQGELIHTLQNPNRGYRYRFDSFGTSVDICGNYAIVGAYGDEDDSTYSYMGSAYIYNVSSGTILHVLRNENAVNTTVGAYQDNFGASVAISNTHAAVGAPNEDIEYPSDPDNWGGRVYVYSVKSGKLLYDLVPSVRYGHFGYQVAISGSYLLVSAYTENVGEVNFAGKVYVYNIVTGTLLHTIENPEPTEAAWFGVRLDIDKTDVVISTYGTGKAYVYDLTQMPGVKYTLTLPSTAGGYYGCSVFDKRVVVGSPTGYASDGCVVGYTIEDDPVSRPQILTTPDYVVTSTAGPYNWAFGNTVSAHNGMFVVGRNAGSYESTPQLDLFSLYTGESITYTPSEYHTYSSGYKVAISGNNVIVGSYAEPVPAEASTEGLQSGQAYIYSAIDQDLVDRAMILGIRD